eukprot:scaffold22390_cov28-Tisochrysis_lutea.AAC.2
MPAMAQATLGAGSSIRLMARVSARSHSAACTARMAAWFAHRPAEQAVSHETQGPCSPSTYETRPEAMECGLPVTAYALRARGPLRTISAHSLAAMATKTPDSEPIRRRDPEATAIEKLGVSHEAPATRSLRDRRVQLHRAFLSPAIQGNATDQVGAASRHAVRHVRAARSTRQEGGQAGNADRAARRERCHAPRARQRRLLHRMRCRSPDARWGDRRRASTEAPFPSARQADWTTRPRRPNRAPTREAAHLRRPPLQTARGYWRASCRGSGPRPPARHTSTLLASRRCHRTAWVPALFVAPKASARPVAGCRRRCPTPL